MTLFVSLLFFSPIFIFSRYNSFISRTLSICRHSPVTSKLYRPCILPSEHIVWMRMGTFPAPWGVQTSTEHSEVGVEYPAPAKQEANALVAFECLHRGNLLVLGFTPHFSAISFTVLYPSIIISPFLSKNKKHRQILTMQGLLKQLATI